MKQTIRYYDNTVRCFVDTEFIEDGQTIDLISIGAVRSDGAEYYAVSTDAKLHLASTWVRENVIPKLPPYSDRAWRPREQIAKELTAFMGLSFSPSKQDMVKEIWGYYADYNWVVIAQLYGTMMQLPSHFPKYCLDLKQLSYMLGNPTHPPKPEGEHNALVDARWNRDLFAWLRESRPAHVLELSEAERQSTLLAIAHLSVERPGWGDHLSCIARRIDNVVASSDNIIAGRLELYEEFRAMHPCGTLVGVGEDDAIPRPLPVDVRRAQKIVESIPDDITGADVPSLRPQLVAAIAEALAEQRKPP